MREDAVWASDACRKRAERAPRPAKARTRKPTHYRVYAIDLVTGKLEPLAEVHAHDRGAAVKATTPGGTTTEREASTYAYVAIPVRSLRLHDPDGANR